MCGSMEVPTTSRYDGVLTASLQMSQVSLSSVFALYVDVSGFCMLVLPVTLTARSAKRAMNGADVAAIKITSFY